jgi:DNA-binding IclR family transcriptional regulator
LIDSIDRALEILELFLKERCELSVTQISQEIDVHKSTVCRTLETMERRGFVKQNEETGKYWLGLQIYSLGMLYKEKEPLKKLAMPFAKKLAEKFNEGVHITALSMNPGPYPQQVVLEKIQSQQVLNLAPPVGSIAPTYCSASGKCLLAFSPESYLKQYEGCELVRFTEHTITDWDVLNKELAQIRKDGYALDREELEIGLMCIAAPILERDGKVVAAISMSGPVSRIKKSAIPKIIQAVKETAKEISDVI